MNILLLLSHIRRLHGAGNSSEPFGILDGTRRLDLKASLLRQQGRFEEALDLLDQALARSAQESKLPLLLKKAATLSRAGAYRNAVEVLHLAEPCIDGRREPRRRLVHSFALASNLCHLESYTAAGELLPKIKLLAAGLNNELDNVRTKWLSGQVSAGLGRREEAISSICYVREYFERERIPFDFALASLELAVLYLEQGRTRQVRELADEMLWIFKDQRVHKEGLAAIALFCQAAKLDRAEANWTRRLIKYLYRAEHNPTMRFEG